MQRCSVTTERLYTRLGSCFPALLSITGSSGSSSLQELKDLFSSLSSGFSAYGTEESDFFLEYNKRNTSLFERLNERMASLEHINERVSAIRNDSEELEIISLNAMVISIKSGEKGRAFSCITENLKRLSARMIALTNELLVEERRLLEKNNTLKNSFTTLVDAQQDASSGGTEGETADIVPILAEAEIALDRMRDDAGLVMAPIREAMAGIQLQDIIRQSVDQILLALNDLSVDDDSTSEDEYLDRLTFDIFLLDICASIARDIAANVERSIETFSGNWARVHEILDSVEGTRTSFIAAYLNRTSRSSSIPLILDGMIEGFSGFISHIGVYQRGQKTMVGDCLSIVSEIKSLRAIFDNIGPIISRLQHVRITQQIEVAKNAAIRSVQDTVNHMSELILQADGRVQETRKDLEAFISGVEELTRGFSADAESDHRELERIKLERTEFFNKMRDYQAELARAVTSLQVYPDSFAAMCAEVDGHIAALREIHGTVSAIAREFETVVAKNKVTRDETLAKRGVDSWSLSNGRLRDLVTQFTITSHKEFAGMIGGFEVEQSQHDSKESGDVTLFF